jgi:microcystin-dependent protein
MKTCLIILLSGFCLNTAAQNLGVGTDTPLEKLDVNGNTKANSFIITIGGAIFDFLIKNDATGEIGYRKGHGGLGINFIICTTGVFPSQNALVYEENGPSSIEMEANMMGTIRIIAGNVAPRGWMFCHGQTLPINTNQAFFSLIGTTYGGDGATNFKLPDMRAMAPVCQGVNSAGYSWLRAQRSDIP